MTPPGYHKLAIVIPTIGRYDDLRRMLQSLAAQTRLPHEVVIVDQDETSQCFVTEFPRLRIQVIALPGSASLKRNAGFRAVMPDADLIGFMDDDIVLEAQAVEALMRFWESTPEDLGGTSLNVLNDTVRTASRLKGHKITSRLGLYSTRRGTVLRSGFHVPLGQVSEITYVDWLPTYCVVYRRDILHRYAFDEFFEGYSYLEDLDFSYRVGKRYRLAVVPDARFYHFPSHIGRPNLYLLGKKEVFNRLHFARKHREFSRLLCWLSLSIRVLMTSLGCLGKEARSNLQRLAGNIAAVFLYFIKGLRPV